MSSFISSPEKDDISSIDATHEFQCKCCRDFYNYTMPLETMILYEFIFLLIRLHPLLDTPLFRM